MAESQLRQQLMIEEAVRAEHEKRVGRKVVQ